MLFFIMVLNSLNFISLTSKLSIIFWILFSHNLLYFSMGSSNFLHFQQCIAKYMLFSLCNGHFGLSLLSIIYENYLFKIMLSGLQSLGILYFSSKIVAEFILSIANVLSSSLKWQKAIIEFI